MLGLRIISALVAGPLVLVAGYWGRWPLALLVALSAGLAWWEMRVILRCHEIELPPWSLGWTLLLLFAAPAGPVPLDQALAAIVIVSLAETVLRCGRNMYAWGWQVATGLYTGFLLRYLLLIRGLLGPGPLFLVLAVTWGADTAAYFIGLRFGRHRLAPTISPGKSVEGAAAGVVGAMLSALLVARLFTLSPPVALAAGAAAGVVGPLGDLAESALKRWAGVKDSSRLIPGHGGVLDRLDSLLFVAPTVYYILLWLG
ncbi:MAG: phosphatidate cytidylyltransferase [Bacillota bacterium]